MRYRGLPFALLGAVGWVASCSPPPPVEMCQPTFSGMRPSGSEGERLVVAGDEANLVASVPMICPSGIKVRATVSVQDPNNAQLAPVETEPATERIQNAGTMAVARFRTTIPGPYHLSVRFEPNLGLFQADVIAAENRRDAGPEVVVKSSSLLSTCQRFDVSEHGRALCLAGVVRVGEADGGITLLEANTLGVARSGPVLWVVSDGGEVTRWEETAAGFVRSPSVGVKLQLGISDSAAFAARPEGLAFAAGTDLGRVSLDAGTLVVERSPFLEFITDSARALWTEQNNFVLAAGFNEAKTSEILCVGKFGTAIDAGTCGQPSLFGPVQLLATEGAGIWMSGNDLTTFPALPTLILRTHTQLREFVIPAPWLPPDGGSLAWDTGAYLVQPGRTLLVADRQGTTVFQKFPELPLINLTSRWLAVRDRNGDVLLFRR